MIFWVLEETSLKNETSSRSWSISGKRKPQLFHVDFATSKWPQPWFQGQFHRGRSLSEHLGRDGYSESQRSVPGMVGFWQVPVISGCLMVVLDMFYFPSKIWDDTFKNWHQSMFQMASYKPPGDCKLSCGRFLSRTARQAHAAQLKLHHTCCTASSSQGNVTTCS